MAITTLFHAPLTATTESFRQYVTMVRNSFQSASWIRPVTSGAIDVTTVGPPAQVGLASAGFDVFLMNDALSGGGSGSVPVFIRIDYSRNSAVSGQGMFITVGFSHDGSGNLSPIHKRTTIQVPTVNQIATAVSGTSYFAGSSSWYVASFVPNAEQSNGNSWMFGVERTKDINGNDTADGVLIAVYSGNSGQANYTVLMNHPTGALAGHTGSIFLLSSNSPSTVNGRVSISPIYHFYGAPLPPGRNFLMGKTTDFINGSTTNTINVYGTSSNYFFVHTAAGYNNISLTAAKESVNGYLMRWE